MSGTIGLMSSGVEFDEDSLKYTALRKSAGFSVVPGQSDNQPRMVRWLMNKGIVKSPAVGQVLLFVIIAINIIITFIVIKFFL